MRNHLYLTIVDVDKIQEFIFESTRLKHIVGASVLIAYLTSRKFCIDGKILEPGNEAIDIGQLENARWMEIYFGGGNMKLLFAKKEEAERFLRNYQLQFAKTVESASFTSIIYKIDTGSANKFEGGWKDAEMELKKVKQAKEKTINNYANPVFEICHFCEKRNAEKNLTLFNLDKDKPEMACRDCCKKDESQDKKNLETFLKETLLARFMNRYYKEGKEFMEEFDDLKGDEGAFLGIATIDGNRFGEMIKNAVNDQISKSPTGDEANQYIHLLNRLSADINNKILEALHQTLDDFKDKLTGRNKKILFRPIIIGGDDICFVMEGKRVVPFTEKLINALEKEDFGGYRLKFAAGISITKPNFPFFIAHQLSESLLKNVKKGNREFSGLDFEVIYTSSVENLEQMRKNKYEYKMDGKTYITTMRPYYFGDIDEKYKNFNTTLSIALGVENRGLLARNKIKQMRSLVRKGQVESEYEFRRMIGRMSQGERNGIWKRLGMIYPKSEERDERKKIWIDINGRLHNNFIDLSELNEFYPDKK